MNIAEYEPYGRKTYPNLEQVKLDDSFYAIADSIRKWELDSKGAYEAFTIYKWEKYLGHAGDPLSRREIDVVLRAIQNDLSDEPAEHNDEEDGESIERLKNAARALRLILDLRECGAPEEELPKISDEKWKKIEAQLSYEYAFWESNERINLPLLAATKELNPKLFETFMEAHRGELQKSILNRLDHALGSSNLDYDMAIAVLTIWSDDPKVKKDTDTFVRGMSQDTLKDEQRLSQLKDEHTKEGLETLASLDVRIVLESTYNRSKLLNTLAEF